MSNLERATHLICEAQEEIGTLRYQADQTRLEIHQLRQRLERAQQQNRELENRVAELELAAERADARANSAVAATLAHTARTS